MQPLVDTTDLKSVGSNDHLRINVNGCFDWLIWSDSNAWPID